MVGRGVSKKSDAAGKGRSKSTAQKRAKRRKRSKDGRKVSRRSRTKTSSSGDGKTRRKRRRDTGDLGEAAPRRRKRTKKTVAASTVVCTHCNLTVSAVSAAQAEELWKSSAEVCARNQWNVAAHKFYVNLLDDAGFAGKRAEEAEQLANNLQKHSRLALAKTKFRCSVSKCKNELPSALDLQDHLVSAHLKPELKKRRTVDRDARYAFILKSKTSKVVRRKENSRLRRGLLPLVPCQTKYEKANKMLPERLYRFGVINGTISKVASTYFADEVATTAPKRSHGAYDCPLAVLSCTVRTNSFPYGIVSLPGGGFSASGFKEQEEQNKYLLPIPKLPPPPPATSPDQPWLLNAWELLNQIELNSQRDTQIREARLDDQFKRIGISDASLVDIGRREKMVQEMPQWVMLLDVAENTYVKAAVARIDEQVKAGVPPFFFATENRTQYFTRNNKSKRRGSQISVGSSSRLSISSAAASVANVKRRRRRSSSKSQDNSSRTSSPPPNPMAV